MCVYIYCGLMFKRCLLLQHTYGQHKVRFAGTTDGGPQSRLLQHCMFVLATHTPAVGCCSTIGLLQQQMFGGAPTFARARAWWRALAVGFLCERERTQDRSHLHSLCAGYYSTALAPLLCVSDSPFSVPVPYFFFGQNAVMGCKVGCFSSNSIRLARPSGQYTVLSKNVEQYIYINIYVYTYIHIYICIYIHI